MAFEAGSGNKRKVSKMSLIKNMGRRSVTGKRITKVKKRKPRLR